MYLSYNLKAGETSFSWGVLSTLQLGEEGRGRWRTLIPCPQGIEDKTLVSLVSSKSGKPKIVLSNNPGNNIEGTPSAWLACVSSYGGYTRGCYGSVYVTTANESRVKVVASGSGAFGDAGRIGRYFDFLLVVSFDTLVLVDSGSKADPYYLYFDRDDVFKVSRDGLHLFCDSRDILLSDFYSRQDEVVDLAKVSVSWPL